MKIDPNTSALISFGHRAIYRGYDTLCEDFTFA